MSSENGLILFENDLQLSHPTVLSTLILDCSPSMERYGDVPRDSVNEHIKSLRETDDEKDYVVCVVGFGSTARVLLPTTNVAKNPTVARYGTIGSSTLLYETVDQVLMQLLTLPVLDPKVLRVVVGVFSDGMDNESDESIHPRKIRGSAEKALARRFELNTFGIGIGSADLARFMGFPDDKGHTQDVEASAQGVRDATMTMTHTTQGFGWRPKKKEGSNQTPV